MTTPSSSSGSKRYKLAVLVSHPIQYFSPLFRRLAQEDDIELMVYYTSRQGVDTYYDADMRVALKWDIPLLDGYSYKFLPDWRGNTPEKNNLRRFQPSIVSEIMHQRHDLLWVHGYGSATYMMAIAAAKLSGTALFMRGDTQLNSLRLQTNFLKKKLRSPLLTLLLKLFTGALSIGTENTEHYLVHGMAKEQIFLVPFTVDNTFFMKYNHWNEVKRNEVKRALGIPTNMPVILFVGKFTANKQPLMLLEAFCHMKQKTEKPVALVLVGDGEQKPALEAYCIENAVNNVIFAGFINQSQIIEYYAVANALVLLSMHESWGLVVNEAMCAKNAVIASNTIGCAVDLVHEGENGFIFPYDNVECLESCLMQIVTDDSLRERMEERSLSIISAWSLEEDVMGIRQALLWVEARRKRQAE